MRTSKIMSTLSAGVLAGGLAILASPGAAPVAASHTDETASATEASRGESMSGLINQAGSSSGDLGGLGGLSGIGIVGSLDPGNISDVIQQAGQSLAP